MSLWQKKSRPALEPVGVCLDGVREALESTRSGQVVLGVGETGGAMMLDLDYSHTLIVGDTGSGTSVLTRSVLAQVLADGAEVVVIDRARQHRWANGHPDVTQVWTLDEISDQLVRLAAELFRRRRVAESDILSARRLVVAIENRAGLAEALQERWTKIRRPYDAEVSLAVQALHELEWASPLMGIHLVATANSGVCMSPRQREAYSVRILSGRVGEMAWPVFSGGVSRPLAAMSRRPGRFWVVRGATTVELTALHLTPAESQHLVAALIAADRRKWGVA